MFNKKAMSLDELYKAYRDMDEDGRAKFREKFFDAERDEVKSYANREIAKDDAEEGRNDAAAAAEEKADEERDESEEEKRKSEDSFDEAEGDGKANEIEEAVLDRAEDRAEDAEGTDSYAMLKEVHSMLKALFDDSGDKSTLDKQREVYGVGSGTFAGTDRDAPKGTTKEQAAKFISKFK